MPADGDPLSRRRYLRYAGAATAAATLAGCADGGDEPTGSVPGDDPTDEPEATGAPTPSSTATPPAGFPVVVTQGQLDSGLDPHDHAEAPTDSIVTRAYEGLLDRDKEGGIVPALATNWERVEAGEVTFAIREGVTFHGGDALTPEDVAFSIRRIVDDNVGFPSPQKNDLGAVTEVQPGDGAVTVRFDGLNPIAFQLFATNGEVMQRSWVEGNSRDFINQHTNGTGPFTVTSYDAGNEVVYERFEDYWGDLTEVTELTFNAAPESGTRVDRLLRGETDVAVDVPPQDVQRVRNSNTAGISPVPGTRVVFLYMRSDLEPFSSQRFRQAMNFAVDVGGIVENVLDGFGTPTGQPTLEPFTGYNPDVEPYPHDPGRAEQLVEQSGHAGVEIELQTPVGRYPKDVEVAQAAASQIDSLSTVTCTLRQREFESLVQDLVTGNVEDKPPFSLLGWGNDEFDAAGTIVPLLTSGGALTTFANDEIDGLVAHAQREPDPETRAGILREANARLHELAPWVFLNRQFSIYGVSGRLQWQPRADEVIDVETASRR